MSPYDLNGPWTGAALDEPPYRDHRPISRFKIAFWILAALFVIGVTLAGLPHLAFVIQEWRAK